MDFGIYLRRAKTYPKMLELALKSERLGFQGVYLNDHVHGFANDGKEEYLEAWTAMTGIGMNTTRIRIGQIVLFNSLRNPAFLAKSIATLDQMTNGRFEFLIGAGWNEPEYIGYDLMEGGRGMPSAKERVDRFEESLEIIKLMLSQEITNFEGKFWKLKNAINNPLPLQRPMRISVGCSKPRMMQITAKYANGINIGARSLTSIEESIDKFSSIVQKQGKMISDYYVSGFGSVQIMKDDEEVQKVAKEIADRMEISVEKVLEDRFIGTTEQIVEKMRRTKDLGLKMMVTEISSKNYSHLETLDVFHDQVVAQI